MKRAIACVVAMAAVGGMWAMMMSTPAAGFGHRGVIDELQNRVNRLENRISSLELSSQNHSHYDLEGRISDLESDSHDENHSHYDLEGRISNLELGSHDEYHSH